MQTLLDYDPVLARDADELLSCLSGRGWIKAAKIAETLGWCDRTIRAAASRSAGLIISGDKGYCRTDAATTEERRHAVARLRSQSLEMLKRADAIERVGA